MQNMHRFDPEELRAAGFEGFITVGGARDGGVKQIPDRPGLYAVLRGSTEDIVFLEGSAGGRFKGKDPTVPIGVLEARWVPGAELLYIGKADRLPRRVRELLDFSRGRPVGHWGERFLWQVEGSGTFLVAWCESPDGDPRGHEQEVLEVFRENHGGRQPFANIAR